MMNFETVVVFCVVAAAVPTPAYRLQTLTAIHNDALHQSLTNYTSLKKTTENVSAEPGNLEWERNLELLVN